MLPLLPETCPINKTQTQGLLQFSQILAVAQAGINHLMATPIALEDLHPAEALRQEAAKVAQLLEVQLQVAPQLADRHPEVRAVDQAAAQVASISLTKTVIGGDSDV